MFHGNVYDYSNVKYAGFQIDFLINFNKVSTLSIKNPQKRGSKLINPLNITIYNLEINLNQFSEIHTCSGNNNL